MGRVNCLPALYSVGVADTEIRCAACAAAHPGRRAPLLATVHGTAVLVPVRLSQHDAQRLGVPRSGLWWQKAAVDDDGHAVLSCRRCGATEAYKTETTAAAARSAALPSVYA